MPGTSLAVLPQWRPELYHYSDALITTVKAPMVPGKDKSLAPYKPAGLWVSVDESETDGKSWGWADWCKAEDFRLEDIEFRHRVVLNDSDSLLWLTTEQALLNFDAEYSVHQPQMYSKIILWAEVAAKYTGLVIAPYQWGQRLELMWYYGWDCASGVIWDTSIVSRLEIAS